MDLSSRRSSSRSRPTVRPFIRIRTNGPGAVLPVAAVIAIGLVIGGAGATSRPLHGGQPDAATGAGAVALGSARPFTRRAGLPDTPWLTQRGDGAWVYGRGDRGPLRRLPPGEAGLAIDAASVASVLAGSDGRSIVRFRERVKGRAIRDVAMPIWVSAGAWTSAGLVVTGYGDASMTSDGGLVLVSAETGATTTLVDAGAFAPVLGQPVARGDVLVSPSRGVVASNVCGVERCDLQVVDLASGVVSRPLQGAEGFLRAVTEDAVITTDDEGAWIVARSIVDGAERWRLRDTPLIDPLAVEGGAVVGLVGSNRAGWGIAMIGPDGRTRDLTARTRGDQAVPRIWGVLSSRSSVVIGRTPVEDVLAGGRALSASVLNLRDGHATKVSVELPVTSEAVQ